MSISAGVQVTALTGVKIKAPAGILRVQNPMRSTWRKNPAEWTWVHHLMDHIDPSSPNKSTSTPPIHDKSDPVSYISLPSMNTWVTLRAAWPVALHWLYCYVTGKNLHIVAAFFLYAIALSINNLRLLNIVHQIGLKHGYLDGDKHPRDQIPDASVGKVFLSLQLANNVRPLLPILFAWKASEAPSFDLPVLMLQLTLFPIILDFWFYLYHRACHEVDFLWRIHKTHHYTKHPNSMLTIFADSEQELIEIVLIPLLTHYCLMAMGIPMTFYHWWVVNAFIMFAEIFGHSGLRLYQLAPGPASILLRAIDCELILEDHDLHHRYGWKKTVGYGKQTRVWDRLFGTLSTRIETGEENVDLKSPEHMPIF